MVEYIIPEPDELFFAIKNILEQKEELEYKLESLQNKIPKLVKQFFEKNSEINKYTYEILNQIYWTKIVNFDDLTEILQINQTELKKHLNYSFLDDCKLCRKRIEFVFHSLTQLNKHKTKSTICSLCKEQQIEKKKKRQEQIFDQFKKEEQKEKEKIIQLKTLPYEEYLQTEYWNTLRKLVLKKAKYKCKLCNNTQEKLNVHHKTYEHRGEEWKYQDDLIVLCQSCHKKFHF